MVSMSQHGKTLLLIFGLLLILGRLRAEEMQLLVTVVDLKTGSPIEHLTANNFSVSNNGVKFQIVEATYKRTPVDIVLLVDASALGEMVRSLSSIFIEGLRGEERMSIVAFHESAHLLHDFTSNKRDLLSALRHVSYGNNPRILDALFATLDDAISTFAVGRRVIVLLSAGVEGYSRTPLVDVLRLAREKNTSIYPVYLNPKDRNLLRRLARETGGAHFRIRPKKQPFKTFIHYIFSVLRGYYEMKLTGRYTFDNRVEVKMRGRTDSKVNPWVSAMVLE
jgi:VWFA-related protein